ncbi:hypothetical protein B0H14DRAFT_2910839 [Mycena olivaceomarginata]|nr:hypothetical protein B0H14DRAFT_2910839 [Mycena olivaceomarginata]
MSHIHQPRNHIRHANRAGGFGGFKGGGQTAGGFTVGGITFPGLGETPKTTPETPTSTEPAALSPSETPASTPSAAPAPSSASPSAPESSSSPTTSSTSSTTTTTSTTTHLSIPIVGILFPPSPAVNTTSAMVAPVIGGVAGGILGLTLIIFAITWFMRRRRPTEDAINFDPGTFRRSAMLMTDPPTHQETVERGYNPATPPAMVERRPIYTQASFDNTVGINSPTSGSQLVFQAPYSPITAGPNVSSPVSAYDHHSWGAPNAAPVPVLTRNTSGSSAHSAHSAAGTLHSPPPQNETEYLDLERGTSVTPYQAEQYVEISKRLNTEVPRGLDTPTVSQIDDPFADDDAKEEQAQEVDALPMVQDMSFPAPPSPVHTSSSRYARDSQPPTLPEIVLQSRVSVTSAYLSDSAPGTPGAGQTVFMNAQVGKSPFAESPMGSSRFPVTPSPLASSFSVPSPPAAAVSFPAEHAQARPEAKKRQTVYSTVYDEEDAYGGM